MANAISPAGEESVAFREREQDLYKKNICIFIYIYVYDIYIYTHAWFLDLAVQRSGGPARKPPKTRLCQEELRCIFTCLTLQRHTVDDINPALPTGIYRIIARNRSV